MVNPLFLSLIPIAFLVFSLNTQYLFIAAANLVEVVCIGCGVPLLLFGIIKGYQKAPEAIRHLSIGLSTIVCGIVLSGAINLMFMSLTDASILVTV